MRNNILSVKSKTWSEEYYNLRSRSSGLRTRRSRLRTRSNRLKAHFAKLKKESHNLSRVR